MSGERQPLLAAIVPQVPLRSLDPHRRLSLQEAAAAAVSADIRRRISARIRTKLKRIAARVKHKFRPDITVDSDGEGELAEIISGVPDLEAIFQGEDSNYTSSHLRGGSETSRLIASSLASSYGTINSGPSSRVRHTTVDSFGGGGNSSASGGIDRTGSLPNSRSPSLNRSSTMNQRSCLMKEDQEGDHDGEDDDSRDDPYASSRHSKITNEIFEEMTNPVGKYRRVWLLVIFLFVLWNAIMVPFLLAFQSTWSRVHMIVALFIISYLGDICFCLDVALAFVTPYTRDGIYERNLTEIRKHYLRTWFLPDFLSSFPFDLLLLPFFGIEMVLIARFTRFLRFWKYESYFAIWEQYSTRYPQGIRFFKLMLGLQLILHWMACFWFYCGYRYGHGTTTWLPPYEFKHVDLTTQYLLSIWWSTNIITQVGGDPGLPQNNFERLADFFIAFIAVFIVAMVIGEVTALVSEMTADESELRKKLSILNQFMYMRKLPDELQERIRNYYFTLWNRRGVTDGDTTILAELPSNLRTEVSLIMNQDILGKVPIFQSSSPGFINSLVLHLKPQTFMPREIIVKQHDSGSEMYFISRGQVNVVANDKVVGRIGEGGFFGEVSALQEGALRTATIIAVTFCDLFVLTHEDLQSLFRVFPAERNVIMHVAETRRAKDLLRKTLADSNLLARELSPPASNPAFQHHPVLVNLLIDLFQPLDLKALAERNMNHEDAASPTTVSRRSKRNRNNGSGGANSVTTGQRTSVTMNGLTIDEHGEIIGCMDDSSSDEDGHNDDSYGLGEDSPFMLDDENEGVIFSPQDDSHTIYFIGKGCVDIFAHPELEELDREQEQQEKDEEDGVDHEERRDKMNSDSFTTHKTHNTHDDDDDDDLDSVASDATTEDGGPQHVIRLTEGHFFGSISGEHYRVSAVVPYEFRGGRGRYGVSGEEQQGAIIFALTSHDLPKLHDYYMNLPQDQHNDGRDRMHMKRALVTFLQRHRTPLDYVKSMVSLSLMHNNPSIFQGRSGKNWKLLLKAIATRTSKRPQPSASPTHNQPGHVKKPQLTHAATAHATVGTHHGSKHKLLESHPHSKDDTETLADTPSKTKPLITVSPAAEPSPQITVEPYASGNWSVNLPATPSHASAPNTSTNAAGGGGGTGSARGSFSSQPPSNSPPPPVANRVKSSSPPTLNKPPLYRAVSAGSVGHIHPRSPEAVAVSQALSPLLHRAKQTRGAGEASSQDVSELLAEADMAHNTRHAALTRVNEESSGSGGPPSQSSSIVLGVQGPSPTKQQHSANLEWLRDASSSSAIDARSRSVLSPPSNLPGGSISSPKPDFKRVPSVPMPRSTAGGMFSLPGSARGSIAAQQALLRGSGDGTLSGPVSVRHASSHGVSSGGGSFARGSFVQAGPSGNGSPDGPILSSMNDSSFMMPPPTGRRHHREHSQPFSFLLALPQGQGAGLGLGSGPPPLQSSGSNPGSGYGILSPLAGGGSTSGTMSTLASPRISGSPGSVNGEASPNQKRGSGSTPSRRHSISQHPAKSRADFLEKSLANLSSEDLLLISTKANMHLFSRMQHAQQEATLAQQAAAKAEQYSSPPTTSSTQPFTPAPRF